MASSADEPVIELKKQDLETLLCQQYGKCLTVKDFSTKPLTAPGDNYGSTILDVEVIYQQDQDETLHKLPLVAKLAPPSAFLRAAFNIAITFRNEMSAYTLICPEFINLQKDVGLPDNEIVDVFPKFYGARSNKQGDINERADETAVLLLENLKASDYRLGNRRLGFNLEHMKLVVKTLAFFHAAGVALKMKKPKIFKEVILKACQKHLEPNTFSDEDNEKWVNSTLESAKLIPECQAYLEKIENALREQITKDMSLPPPSGPFTTIIHNDFWVNNMMFKYKTTGNNKIQNNEQLIPIEVKFVDFQITLYDSPIRDLIFLLFSSSEEGLIEEHLDDLLKLYHREFTDVLKRLECDTNLYSFQAFQEELNEFAPKEFVHCLFMVKPITADSNEVRELADVDMSDMLENKGGDLYINKGRTLILEYVKRGWI